MRRLRRPLPERQEGPADVPVVPQPAAGGRAGPGHPLHLRRGVPSDVPPYGGAARLGLAARRRPARTRPGPQGVAHAGVFRRHLPLPARRGLHLGLRGPRPLQDGAEGRPGRLEARAMAQRPDRGGRMIASSFDLQRGVLKIGVTEYLAELDPAAPGLGLILRRLDGKGGPYRVARQYGRVWRCSCPAYRYRKGPEAPYGCKHTHAARGLFDLTERLTPQKDTLPMTAKKKIAPATSTPEPAAPEAPVPEIVRIAAALAAPFPAECVEWLPKNVTGGRALALAYI